MTLVSRQQERIVRKLEKGFSAEEVAYIEGVDVGLVRSVQVRKDYPTLSPTSSRNYFGREKVDE